LTLSDKNRKRLQAAVRKFRTANILVIGDIIVDHFIWGSVSRISPEAPVPVVNVTHENLMLGGSANVLHNIYAQGAKSALCGVIGTDAMGDHLLRMLTDLGSPTGGIVRSDNRPTILKTRIVAQHQQVVRFDREKTGELSKARLAEVKSFLDSHLADFDAVIVSDYDKGMISPALMNHLRKLLAKSKIPLIVDPKPRHAERFKGVTIITPNHHEAELMSGMKIGSEKELTAAAQKMQKTLGCQAVLITRGEAGMALFEKGQPLYTIPTVAKEVYDVTGAGDTVAATLALGLAVGLGFAEAATLANFAAGIVVGKVGTATASTEELLRAIA
jgi:D-beta-D-heptose 7-phosphate kinase/D-beta-D-heptose 1-phosphate adenosyltransferase